MSVFLVSDPAQLGFSYNAAAKMVERMSTPGAPAKRCLQEVTGGVAEHPMDVDLRLLPCGGAATVRSTFIVREIRT